MKQIALRNSWWGVPEGGSSDTLVIEGTDSYRNDALFRAVSDFLCRLGWETKKTNHALRAYASGQIAMKYGIYEAQVFLRHSTRWEVTEQSYYIFCVELQTRRSGHHPRALGRREERIHPPNCGRLPRDCQVAGCHQNLNQPK